MFIKRGHKLFLFHIDYWQSAAEDMQNAIQEMKIQGVHSYILDLRNNPVNHLFLENLVVLSYL